MGGRAERFAGVVLTVVKITNRSRRIGRECSDKAVIVIFGTRTDGGDSRIIINMKPRTNRGGERRGKMR